MAQNMLASLINAASGAGANAQSNSQTAMVNAQRAKAQRGRGGDGEKQSPEQKAIIDLVKQYTKEGKTDSIKAMAESETGVDPVIFTAAIAASEADKIRQGKNQRAIAFAQDPDAFLADLNKTSKATGNTAPTLNVNPNSLPVDVPSGLPASTTGPTTGAGPQPSRSEQIQKQRELMPRDSVEQAAYQTMKGNHVIAYNQPNAKEDFYDQLYTGRNKKEYTSLTAAADGTITANIDTTKPINKEFGELTKIMNRQVRAGVLKRKDYNAIVGTYLENKKAEIENQVKNITRTTDAISGKTVIFTEYKNGDYLVTPEDEKPTKLDVLFAKAVSEKRIPMSQAGSRTFQRLYKSLLQITPDADFTTISMDQFRRQQDIKTQTSPAAVRVRTAATMFNSEMGTLIDLRYKMADKLPPIDIYKGLVAESKTWDRETLANSTLVTSKVNNWFKKQMLDPDTTQFFSQALIAAERVQNVYAPPGRGGEWTFQVAMKLIDPAIDPKNFQTIMIRHAESLNRMATIYTNWNSTPEQNQQYEEMLEKTGGFLSPDEFINGVKHDDAYDANRIIEQGW